MKFLIQVFLTVLFFHSFSQNESHKWYFGRFTGLDFMTSPPTVISHTTMNTFEGSASIADGAGNLLFYTDGLTVWNQNQLVMANGTGLMGNGSTVQSALIVKQPGNTNIYFVFTLDLQGGANGLRYSTVDMNLAAGMGSVTIKNVPVSAPCTEQLNGTRHCNGVDMWVVTHELNTNNFRSYLLTASGLNLTPVISGVGPAPPTFTPNNVAYGQGTIKISPNGKKLGLTFHNGSPNNEVSVFDFDKSTGLVSNYLSLLTSTLNHYGCEFSGDGTKFYIAATQGSQTAVYQWDLCAGSNSAILSSQVSIVTNTPTALAQLQLAPNGKIYIVRFSSQMLAAIDNPNVQGPGCNYVGLAQSVATGTNGVGLPNFVGSSYTNLSPFTSTISCGTVSFTAPPIAGINPGCTASGYSVTSILWNFDHPASGALNFSSLSSPSHTFAIPGTYQVKLILNYACGADTLFQTLALALPNISVSGNTLICSGKTGTLNASGADSYSWNTGSTSPAITFSPTVNTTFTVTGTNSLTNCSDSKIVSVAITPSPTVTLTGNFTICSGASASISASGANNYAWSNGSTGFSISVSPTTSINYTVTGYDASATCSDSKTISLIVLKCLDIEKPKPETEHVRIYPNPAHDELFVETPEELQLSLIDITGRTVFVDRMRIGKNQIPLKVLQPGVYFLKYEGAKHSSAIKIIRND